MSKNSLDKINSLFIDNRLNRKFKFFLIALALVFSIVVIIFTQVIVEDLVEKEQNLIRAYSNVLQNLENPELENIEFYLFLNDEILPNISFPLILTDANDIPNYPFIYHTRNVELDTNLSISEQRDFLKGIVDEMKDSYEPIVIVDNSQKVLSKIYYKNSQIVEALQFYPYIAIIFVIIVIIIGLVIFTSVKKNEESKVWVGMSKEAAHQLGTPLSSLLAWMEILRINIDNPNSISETLSEMDNDINRMKIIANRFSKIGSNPELKDEHIIYVINSACNYVEKRLPHLGRKVIIEKNFPDKKVISKINVDLFTWVLENLIKNAAESIEEQVGVIKVRAEVTSTKVRLFIKDNGKGMTNKVKKQVFNPGFTTKKRGWGLGLSLSKRIIEDYHKGKIWIVESIPGKGTIFGIDIPVASKPVNN